MKMNPKPELDGSDFTIPKYAISIDMESLNISKYKVFLILVLNIITTLNKILVIFLYSIKI